MKIYKIENSKIFEYTKRNDNRVFKILTITMVTLALLMFLMTKQKDVPAELIYIMLPSYLFSGLIIGLIYLNNKKLTRLTAENLQIIIDENSITRVIDLDNEPRLNILDRISFKIAKNISNKFYEKVDFKDITSMEKNYQDLWIKGTNSNSFNGKNIVLIPKEISDFDFLEMEIRAKQKEINTR